MEVDGVKIINTQLVSFFSIFVVEARPRGEVRFRPLPFLSPGGEEEDLVIQFFDGKASGTIIRRHASNNCRQGNLFSRKVRLIFDR